MVNYLLPAGMMFSFGLALLAIPRPMPPTPSELVELGVAYVKAKKEPLAWQAFNEALATEPQHFRGNYSAGILAFQQNDSAAAERYLKAALVVNSQDADALLTLGAVYHRERMYDEAGVLYRSVFQNDKMNVKATYNLGMLALETKQLREAKAYFERYVALAPDSKDARVVEAQLAEINERLETQKK